jgi:hypothetical protein
MKKIILCLTLLLVGIINIKAQIGDDLAKNSAFIENIKIINEISKNVDKNFGENLKDLSAQIELSKSKVMTYEESVSQAATLLKIDEKTFSDNLNTIKNNYLKLKAEFGENLTEENILDASKKIDAEMAGKASPSTYAACCIVAGALGFTTMTACVGATWGFGAPWCFAAAVIVQTAAIHVCAHNYLH